MNRLNTENRLFKKAKLHYHKELDIIEILRKVRDGENFRKLFLTKQQMMLLKFGSMDVIDDSPECKQSDVF